MAAPPTTDLPEAAVSTDTHYVLVEIGKLSGSLAWLIEVAKQQGDKIDVLQRDMAELKTKQGSSERRLDENVQETKSVRQDVYRILQQLVFVKGMLYAIVGMLVVGGFLLSSKGDTIISLLRALPK